MSNGFSSVGLARQHGGGGQEFAVDLALLEAVEVQEGRKKEMAELWSNPNLLL